MIGFIIAAVVMTVVAVLFIFWPFSKRNRQADAPAQIERDRSNLEIARDQLKELEQDFTTGVIGKSEYEESRVELERRALEEAGSVAAQKKEQKKSGKTETPPTQPKAVWAVALFLGILLAGSALYWVIGTPDTFFPRADMMASSGEQNADDPHNFSPEQFEAMLQEFAERMENDPDDLEGWLMLARSYAQTGKTRQAIEAYERIIDRIPEDANVFADYADILAYEQGGNLAGRPIELVERALKIDPSHWKALGLAGTYAFDKGDYRQAELHWLKMKSSLPTGSEMARMMDVSIAEARRLQEEGAAPQQPATEASNEAASDAYLSGTVSLAPEFQDRVSPDNLLLVYTYDANGPTTPIASISKHVSDLPFSFVLDASTLTIKSETLDAAEKLVVAARISKSGQPRARPGDLEGASEAVSANTENIQIVINKELQ